VTAAENAADHLSFLFVFMPDFARSVYQSEPWFEALKRASAMSCTAARGASGACLFCIDRLRRAQRRSGQPGGTRAAAPANRRACRHRHLLAQASETTLFADH
jgi:hypothetical protein